MAARSIGASRCRTPNWTSCLEAHDMTQKAETMDAVVLAISIGFFALMFGYIRVCEIT